MIKLAKAGRIKIANNLKEIIREKGISQYELAHRMGVAYETVNRWANAKQDIGANGLSNLAKCLGVNTQELLKGVEVEDLL